MTQSNTSSLPEPKAPRLVWQSGIYRIVEKWHKNEFYDDEEDLEPYLQDIIVEQAGVAALGEPVWLETKDLDLPNDALRELLGDIHLIEVQR